MVRLQTTLIALSIFVTCFHSVSGQENGEETPQTIENPSPDGRFAFRNTGDSDSETQTYDLIDKDREKSSRVWQSLIPISAPVHGSI
jgi:hypothetical protein